MLLSVIIPLYNCGSYVERCIKSVYSQGLSESDFEVIVVDDGSTDDGSERVAREAERRDNLRLVVQTNQGVSSARNRAVAVACHIMIDPEGSYPSLFKFYIFSIFFKLMKIYLKRYVLSDNSERIDHPFKTLGAYHKNRLLSLGICHIEKHAGKTAYMVGMIMRKAYDTDRICAPAFFSQRHLCSFAAVNKYIQTVISGYH